MPATFICAQCKNQGLPCDGQQPRCGFCQISRTPCERPQRGSRGPKKGYLNALRSRVVHLEGLLERRISTQQQTRQEGGSTNQEDNSSILHPNQPNDGQNETTVFERPAFDGDIHWLLPMNNVSNPIEPPENSLQSTMSIASDTGVLKLRADMQAELNQLYFDRFHSSMPLLHQRRFMSRAKSSSKTQSCKCLQYATWTLATLFSAQFRDLTEPLYLETRQMLDSLVVSYDRDSVGDTALVQASVLIAICESIRAHHHQAWMSAGRTFRLVQGLRFHEIDSPQSDAAKILNLDPTEVEERRRAFWVAYFLDHLFSIRNDWPITLNEHVICTRMPASEESFQSSNDAVGPFLSEAMVDNTQTSPFNECLILATIWGRSLLRCQQYKISQVYGGPSFDLVAQNQWLDEILTARIKAFSEAGSPSETNSPLSAFVAILGHTSVVYNCKGAMETLSSATDTRPLQIRSSSAIATIVSLLQPLRELHYSKVHPLMPFAVFVCAEFLYSNKESHESFRERLQDLSTVLSELQNVNDPDQSYLDLLPRSCVSTTTEWLSDGIGSTINR